MIKRTLSYESNHHGGVYFHIPFCIKKCRYCDFYSTTDLSLMELFVKSLMCEINLARDTCFLADTIYLGGGTPSVLDVEDIEKIIKATYSVFNFLPDTEITIEVNPATVNSKQLKHYIKSGINRLNIGVQSFVDANLVFLGRIHSGSDAIYTIKESRKAGFNNIGLDLIYGIPGQSTKSWISDLEKAVQFEPDHLSCYMMTYEPGTPMEIDRQKKRFSPLSESLVSEMFKITIDFLESEGFVQYEISNFAREQSGKIALKMSRHNIKYWSFVPYMGFGPGAHSFIEQVRYWNHRSLKKYIRDLDMNRFPVEEKEILNKKQQITEAVYLGLRQTAGICIDDFNEKFGVEFRSIFEKVITYLKNNRLAEINKNWFALTQNGMLYLNSIVLMFMNFD